MKKSYPKLKSKKVKWDGDRIIGCQSTNHIECYGDLWVCDRCHKMICWEEGCADDLVDVCDDCWYDIVELGRDYFHPDKIYTQRYPPINRHYITRE